MTEKPERTDLGARRNVHQVVDLVRNDASSGGFYKAIDPIDVFERVPMVVQDLLFDNVAQKNQLFWVVRKSIDNSSIARFTRRCIAKLEHYHWFIRKALFLRKLRIQQMLRVVHNGGRLRWSDEEIQRRVSTPIINEIQLGAVVDSDRRNDVCNVLDSWPIQVSGFGRKIQNGINRVLQHGKKWGYIISLLPKVVCQLPKFDKFGNYTSGPYLVNEKTRLGIDSAMIGDEALKLIANGRKRSRKSGQFNGPFVLELDDQRMVMHTSAPAVTPSYIREFSSDVK